MYRLKEKCENTVISTEASMDQNLTDRLIKATDLAPEKSTERKCFSRAEVNASSRKARTEDVHTGSKSNSRGSSRQSHNPPLYTEFNELLSKLFRRYKESSASVSSTINPPEFLVSPCSSKMQEQTPNNKRNSNEDLVSGELRIKESFSFMKDLLYPPLTYGVPPTPDRNFIVANARVIMDNPKFSPGKEVTTAGKSTASRSPSRPESRKKKQTPVIEYQLSNLENVMKGYTAPPENFKFAKLYSFLAVPSNQQWDGFRSREVEKTEYYYDGSLAVRLEIDGTGKIFYPNGDLAIILADSRIGRRMLILSQRGKEPDGSYKDSIPIALFDQKGNGVVYDINGKMRLNYDQAEGVLYDSGHGLPVRWKWARSGAVFQRRKELECVPEDPDDWEPEPRKDNNRQRKGSPKNKSKNTEQKSAPSTKTPRRSPCSLSRRNTRHSTKGKR